MSTNPCTAPVSPTPKVALTLATPMPHDEGTVKREEMISEGPG